MNMQELHRSILDCRHGFKITIYMEYEIIFTELTLSKLHFCIIFVHFSTFTHILSVEASHLRILPNQKQDKSSYLNDHLTVKTIRGIRAISLQT